MTDRIYLGSLHRERIYLTKHKWDCDWYWGFGYLGNSHNHFHISSMIKDASTSDILDHFDTSWITQKQWWILRDLFIQAYAIKDAAFAYRLGGHQTGDAEPYRIKSEFMELALNEDLETLLNTIWDLLKEWKGET